jgi:hypothetical protein
MEVFLISVGYLLFVAIGVLALLMCFVFFQFGGGDCGPIFGNWVHKGTRESFCILLVVTGFLWFFIIKFCPFTVSIST